MPKLTEKDALKIVRKKWNPTGTVNRRGKVFSAGYVVFGRFRAVSTGSSWEQVIKGLPKHHTDHVSMVSFPPAD